MAPTLKSTPIRRPLTLKGVERKKRGPAPKPLAEKLKAKALKQIKRVERSYTRERKVEVLLYLLTHRVPDSGPRKTPRRRIGQPQEDCSTQPIVENKNGELVWYRAPTYAEASDFWKIPTPTIQGWWDSRDKLLEGTGIEVPKVGPGGVPKALEGWKPLSQRSFRTKEGMQQEEPDVTATNSSTTGAPPTPSSSGPPSASSSSVVPTTPAPIAPLKPTVRIIGRVNPQPHYKPPPAPRTPAPLAPAPAPQIAPAQNGPAPRAPPVQAPPVLQVNRPAAQPAPQPGAKPGPQPGAHPQAYPQVPPAFNPSNYVVLYTGPHPGPWSFPGQICIPPGTVLPIVYAGQPVELGPPCFVTVYPGPAPLTNGAPAPNGTHHRPPQPPPQPGQHPMPHPPPQPGQAQGPHGAHPPSGYHPPHPSHGPPPTAQPPHAAGAHPVSNQGQPQAQRPTGPPPSGPYIGPSGYVSPYAPPGFAPTSQTNPPPQPPQNTVSQGRSSLRTPGGANTGRASKPKPRAQPPPAVPNGGVSTQQGQPPFTAQGPPPAAGSNFVSAPIPGETQAEEDPVQTLQQGVSGKNNRADVDKNDIDQVEKTTPSTTQAAISLGTGDRDIAVESAVPVSTAEDATDRDLLSTEEEEVDATATATAKNNSKGTDMPEENIADATPSQGEVTAAGVVITAAEDDDDAAMEEALEQAMEEAMQEDDDEVSSVGTPGSSSSGLSSPITEDGDGDGAAGETPMEIDDDEGGQSSSGGEEEFETPYETPAAVVETEGEDGGDDEDEDEDDVMVDTPAEDSTATAMSGAAQQLASEVEAVESEEE
ncbi:hypothetical protein B0T21DRAFT_351098 [Apiosordaria backusii]|uniref:Uncharacterized protein n=1 Tax=Apiosordaria backusii TaxID=314023 RepID=A0AA40AXU0_9PEZI|nr:hypothetical protein B0T21DRAFT_351098 [Apiosordaria backusii]